MASIITTAIAIAADSGIDDWNFVCSLVDLDTDNCKINHRRKRKRNEDYFEVIVPQYHDSLFAEHFRMSRGAFDNLVCIIGNCIINKDHPISLPKRVMFTLWLLSKPESFLAARDRFCIPKSSCHGVFKEIVSVLSGLIDEYVKWPDEGTYKYISGVFQKRSRGIPGIIGAIDGCHIPCKQPPHNANDYYNRKSFHSIILQGTCDHTGKFIDCFIGMPGRMHDSRVFRCSSLFKKLTAADKLLPNEYHLIGDCAYPLSIYLLTPFRDNGHLSNAQSSFNTKLSSVRSVIERAFGLLKGKWRRLKYLDISDFVLGNRIIAACCVLHNFLILNKETDIIGSEMELNCDVEADSYLQPIEGLGAEKREYILIYKSFTCNNQKKYCDT